MLSSASRASFEDVVQKFVLRKCNALRAATRKFAVAAMQYFCSCGWISLSGPGTRVAPLPSSRFLLGCSLSICIHAAHRKYVSRRGSLHWLGLDSGARSELLWRIGKLRLQLDQQSSPFEQQPLVSCRICQPDLDDRAVHSFRYPYSTAGLLHHTPGRHFLELGGTWLYQN